MCPLVKKHSILGFFQENRNLNAFKKVSESVVTNDLNHISFIFFKFFVFRKICF